MEFLLNPLHSNFLQALFWTFIHSFWQAAFLAIIAGLLLSFSKSVKPGLRYNVLALLFLLFVVGNCITFLYLWGDGQNRAVPLHVQLTGMQIGAGTALFQFLNAYAPLLLLTWSFVFGIKCMRLGMAFRQVRRIKHRAVSIPDTYWNASFQGLLERLKVNKNVRLTISKTLTVPATIGFLRPLVVVPLGLFSQLPPDQIEAILLHELAHIKRKDYLANNFQKIIETIFFFNPFLLWISKLIRAERENCCDEIALMEVKDKKILVKALIHFEERQHFPTQLALNFGREKGQLLNRVKRIVRNQNKTLDQAEKIFVAVSLFLFVGWYCSFTRSGMDSKSYWRTRQDESAANKIVRNQVVFQGIVIESVNLSSTQDTLKVARSITEDLIKDGIIQNSESLSYKLDNDELVVNGIKQPVLLHQKLREKYIHEQGWTLFYNQKPKSAVIHMS